MKNVTSFPSGQIPAEEERRSFQHETGVCCDQEREIRSRRKDI